MRENSAKYPRMHLVAPTAADARDVMLEGESGADVVVPSVRSANVRTQQAAPAKFRNGSRERISFRLRNLSGFQWPRQCLDSSTLVLMAGRYGETNL